MGPCAVPGPFAMGDLVSRRAAGWLGVARVVGARAAAAQSYAVSFRLANPTVARDDDFGLALAASGHDVLVGVPLDATAEPRCTNHTTPNQVDPLSPSLP